MHTDDDAEAHDLASYKIHSRREIGAILQAIQENRQLIKLSIRSGMQSGMTSILQVDPEGDNVVVDFTSDTVLNQRLLEARQVKFETMLDSIKISFEADHVEECLFEERLAFVFQLPASLLRLQRREYYRIETPRVNPVQCTIFVPENSEKTSVTLPLENVSGGGVAIIDEKFRLDSTIGRIYDDCRIALPNNAFLIVKLQIRNVREIKLQNGKEVRQIGCRFVDLPRAMLTAVQRYITALEREHSAKGSGF